jgi:murein tripeptide amidase MpaA
VLSACFFLFTPHLIGQDTDWKTYYEKSNFKETPRYDATIKFSKRLAAKSEFISYRSFGKSPQGRDLPLLIVDKGNSVVRENNDKAVMLIQACIHSGESDGKDAGLMLLRDIAIQGEYLDLLDNVTVLFVPIFNVDGHEQFGPHSRINQNGPAEMGWRTTAQRLNLNRDFLKADAPEMQAMINLFQQWLPDFYIDCHVTDGADYLYPLTYGIQMHGNLTNGQSEWLKEDYLSFMTSQMESSGNPIAPYMDFVQWHNPKSGIRAYMETPRYSGGYAAINNRPALLIETHMLKDYKARVTATYHMLLNSLKMISSNYSELTQLNAQADMKASQLSKNNDHYTLTYKAVESEKKFIYQGKEYNIEKSDITGGDWYQYTDIPVTFEIPYYRQEADVKIKLPMAYVIPVELTEIIDKLALHRVRFEPIPADTVIYVETYNFENISWRERPFEGRLMLTYEVEPVRKTMKFAAGSKLVRLNQRAAQLAIHLLEPQAPDALIRWGFLNGIFEQKEYAESYVMEKLAREMMAKDADLKKAFIQKKKNDHDFASNPYAILNWFYQKSPYWDDKIGVYPIGRIMN